MLPARPHRRPRSGLRILRAVLLLAFMAPLWGVTPPLARAAGSGAHPLVGQPAPLLSGRAAFGTGLLNLKKLQQELVYERDAHGNPVRENGRIRFHVRKYAVVLNFFATYCVPCIQEIPVYNRLAEAYAERPVKFVYVNVDAEKSADEVRAFARKKGIAVEMILPSVKYALKAYQIDALPRIVVVNPDGVVTHVILGFQEDLTQQIDAMLSQVLPPRAPAGQGG